MIRLWATSFQVREAGAGVAPLWIGMVTLERLKHPARITTLALTDPDFALASAQLARLLQTQCLTRDLERLARTADQVRQGQPARSRVARDDELGRLARGFNSMLDALETRRRAEEALREELAVSERRLDRALAAANEALWQYGVAADTFTLWARGQSELGLPGERERTGAQVQGQGWRAVVHPDDLPGVRDEFRRALGGSQAALAVSARLRRADGSWAWFDVQGAVVRGPTGAVEGLAGTLLEATERHRREEEHAALEARLRQSQKMEALGRLAGGVAHDFNNMLAAVLAHAGLARSATREPEVRADLDAIIAAARRATGVAGQVLTFSRGRAAQTSPIDLAEVVQEVAAVVQPTLKGEALEVSAPLGVAWTTGERAGLVQVVLNPCVNAREALGGRGRLRLEVRSGVVAGRCASCHEAFAGPWSEVCVSDDGPGIAPEVLPRIFEPFFSTRAGAGGSGLGLAVVHGLVHGWGGHVLVERVDGQTRLRIVLPATPAPRASPPRPRAPEVEAAPALPRRRVLVVDDEPLVGKSLGRVLARKGWPTCVETDPRQALARLMAEPFDLLLTDYAMPAMNGHQLAREARLRGLTLPIVLLSGNTGEVPDSADVAAVFAKPVDFDELVAAMAKLVPAQP